MKEGWMKNDEGWMKNDKVWMKNDEGWKMNDEGWWFQAVEGFCFMTDKQTDICDCRVAFATEKTFTWQVNTASCPRIQSFDFTIVISRIIVKVNPIFWQNISR